MYGYICRAKQIIRFAITKEFMHVNKVSNVEGWALYFIKTASHKTAVPEVVFIRAAGHAIG